MHGPSTDKMGTGANFIRAVLQVERTVNGNLYAIHARLLFDVSILSS